MQAQVVSISEKKREGDRAYGKTDLAAGEVLATSRLQGLLHDRQPSAQIEREMAEDKKRVPRDGNVLCLSDEQKTKLFLSSLRQDIFARSILATVFQESSC